MTEDVLIIGSGPAGMSAAFFLSLDGSFRVTVLERLSDPQYARYHRICGGGISRRTFRELSPMIPSGILNEIHNTRIIWPSGTEVRMRTDGYILDRPAFLSDLKSQCIEHGVSFRAGTAVDVYFDGIYHVRTSSGDVIDSDWLIGADGACSIVRRRLFGSSPAQRVPATECFVDRKGPDDLIIRLSSDRSGTYIWEFPHGNIAGTGGMKGYTERSCLMKGSRFIPIGGVGDIVREQAFLVGDAAAMANPISFGGLKAALISGKKAADAISKHSPENYQGWWNSSILSDNRFMRFNETLKQWSEEDMERAVRPFRHGGIYLPGIIACITQPENIHMYFGCLFAFKFGW